MAPLPLVITLPHCSAVVPPEAAPGLALSQVEVEQSVDLGSAEVFGPLEALAVLPAPVSRLVADLNRRPDDFEPKGVVAHTDYAGRAVFAPGRQPDRTAKKALVERWWRPWHQKLARALELPEVMVLIDGHSLDGMGPAEAPDPGARRADVVLGNRGGAGGEPTGEEPVTCPPELLLRLGRALEEQGLSVAYNQPYSGGYIIRRYGPRLLDRGGAAIQVELNKDCFADPGYSRVYAPRALELSLRLGRALWRVFGSG
jgi:N-formylglutamate amidohydrolase